MVVGLLSCGYSVHDRGWEDWTALYLAVWCYKDQDPSHSASDHLIIVNLLLEAGAAIDAQCNFGRTPLMLAALGRRYAAARRLVAAGASINVRDIYGQTAPDFAGEKADEILVHCSKDTTY